MVRGGDIVTDHKDKLLTTWMGEGYYRPHTLFWLAYHTIEEVRCFLGVQGIQLQGIGTWGLVQVSSSIVQLQGDLQGWMGGVTGGYQRLWPLMVMAAYSGYGCHGYGCIEWLMVAVAMAAQGGWHGFHGCCHGYGCIGWLPRLWLHRVVAMRNKLTSFRSWISCFLH